MPEPKPLNIAIDGPSAAGKSTVAKAVAARLGLRYLDTGAMYRALTCIVLRSGLDPADEDGITALAADLHFELDERSQLVLDGEILGEEIRTPAVTANVSLVSSHVRVREAVVAMQQEIALGGGIVMDGRDIGTVVMPQAELKVFLTADAAERARRRWLEMTAKGYTLSREEIEADIRRRDDFDSSRAASPLRPASDSVILDTTSLSLEQVVDAIIALAGSRMESVSGV